MFMKAQDVVVALDLARDRDRSASYADRAKRLGMSASEVHAAVRRLVEARLLDPDSKGIRRKPFLDFLVHGVPFAFAVSPKELTRGLPTAWAAPPLSGRIAASEENPPVWPDPEGSVQGQAIRPLYRSVPKAAKSDPELYDLLALVDALRIGRVRERKLASEELSERLNRYAAA